MLGVKQLATRVEQMTATARAALHGILCQDLFDSEAAPEWYLEELTAPNLTSETALRAIEIRHSKRELQVLEKSVEASTRSSSIALIVAWISAVASILAVVLAVWAANHATDVDVKSPVHVEVEQPAPASKKRRGRGTCCRIGSSRTRAAPP